MAEIANAQNIQVAHAAVAFEIAQVSMRASGLSNEGNGSKYAQEFARRYKIILQAIERIEIKDTFEILKALD